MQIFGRRVPLPGDAYGVVHAAAEIAPRPAFGTRHYGLQVEAVSDAGGQ
jgi:hypothetical protein